MTRGLLAAVLLVSAALVLSYVSLVYWREGQERRDIDGGTDPPTMVRLLDAVNRFLSVSSAESGRAADELPEDRLRGLGKRKKRQCGGGGFGGGGFPWSMGGGFGGMGLSDPMYLSSLLGLGGLGGIGGGLLSRPGELPVRAQQQVIVIDPPTTTHRPRPFTLRPFRKHRTRKPSRRKTTPKPKWDFEDELDYQYRLEASNREGSIKSPERYNLSPAILRSSTASEGSIPPPSSAGVLGAETAERLEPLLAQAKFKVVKITNYGISIIPRDGIIEYVDKEGGSRISLDGGHLDPKHLRALQRIAHKGGLEKKVPEERHEIFIPFDHPAEARAQGRSGSRAEAIPDPFRENHLADDDALYFRFPSSAAEAAELERLLRVRTAAGARGRSARVTEAIRMAQAENRWRRKSMHFWRALQGAFEDKTPERIRAGEACSLDVTSAKRCVPSAVCEYVFEGESGMRCRCLAPTYAHRGHCVSSIPAEMP